jgi:hypothetical protein
MKRWGFVILVVVSLWVAGASGQQRQVAAPPAVQKWEYAELSYSTGTQELLWTTEAGVVRGEPNKIVDAIAGPQRHGKRLFLADLLNFAGREGWELVSVQRKDESSIPDFWLKRPVP